MKTPFLWILSCLVPYCAFAIDPPQHWIHGDEVYFASRLNADASLLIFKESERKWSYLTVNLEYPKSTKAQADELQKKYPGKKLLRLIPQRLPSRASISIGALGIALEERWTQTQFGPVTGVQFELSRAQTETLLAANDMRIEVRGEVEVHIPKPQVVETLVLPERTCDDLIGSGSSLKEALLRYATISTELEKTRTEYAETKTSLKTSLLRDCISFDGSGKLDTFDQALQTPVKVKAPRTAPHGETLENWRTSEAIPVEVDAPLKPRMGL